MNGDENSGIYLIARSTNREVLQDLVNRFPFLDVMYGPDQKSNGRYEVLFHNSEAERQHIRSWADRTYPPTYFFGIHFEEIDDRDGD